ncbi:hypothetical protein RchiOBHm_Chr2g0116791 [Rosa chinensis]|uniref:Uncharacterized protein n=1 Tax=Rosa chinensis TaxID=74649 RepID=A0A2P6RRC7_ROSCH|nr:hypothetical protein RchiOBHm_Chr2g0116791 [Rosa chinensis]
MDPPSSCEHPQRVAQLVDLPQTVFAFVGTRVRFVHNISAFELVGHPHPAYWLFS